MSVASLKSLARATRGPGRSRRNTGAGPHRWTPHPPVAVALNLKHPFHFSQPSLEYAFHRAFSIEAGIPFARLDLDDEPGTSRLGNAEVALKFANFAFEDKGVLLGYGVEFGLPTGSDDAGIGSDHIVELEPFFNIGFTQGDWELVAFTTFGIPINHEEAEEVETELITNFSTLYHVNSRLQLLLEFDGESVLSGEESGEQTWHLTPGVKFAPVGGSRLFLGVGVRLPLTDKQEFDTQALVSLFYHY